jgi:glycosyltransferase involved in cell wall biosynthesis
MACGDIFMSTSRIEGLQRSLVESMLSGCLVLAFERPDSLFLSESPGVFLCTEDSVVTILEKITALDVSDRLQLGRLNRQYAINHFSCDVVLDKWSELLNG